MRIRLCAVIPILLCVLSCGVPADILSPSKDAADQKRAADIKAARAVITAKDWDNANSLIDAFAAAYANDPATPHFLKAELYRGQGKSTETADEIKAGLLADKARANTAWAVKLLSQVPSPNGAPNADLLERLGDGYRIALYFPEAARCYEAALAKPDLAADKGKRIRRWLIAWHIRGKEWDKAAAEIDSIAAESPECAPWSYYALGKYYTRYGHPSAAATCFQKAMPGGGQPADSPPLKDIQVALADALIGAGAWDKATELTKKLAAQYPNEAAKWHECAGGIYQGQKKYPEAIAELKQAIEPPAAISARKRLAECYQATLPPAASAPLIQELIDKYPNDGPNLPTIVGRIYQDMKAYDKAIADFKVVVTHSPNARWQVWDACYYIGECCYAQGKGDEALTYIKDFYAKHPDRPMDFAIAYGKTLLYGAEKPAEAALVLAENIAAHPKDKLVPEVRNMLIAAYSESGQTEKLAELLASFAADDPATQRLTILATLGTHYISAGKFREAASVYRGLLALPSAGDGLYAQAEYQLGLCYWNSSMKQAARRSMQHVIQRYPGSHWAKQARGLLYTWDGQQGSYQAPP